jgi:hypothetical protein
MRYPAIVNNMVFRLLLAATLALALPAQAKMYKWVDENGRVYYTDTPPPQIATRAVTELGKTGQAMRRTESIDERRIREIEARRIAEQKKTAEEHARRDRALLATYTKESEIDLARDRALEHHKLAIKGAETRMKQVAAKAKDVLDKIGTYTKRRSAIPPHLQNQLAATQKEADDLKKIIRINEEALTTVRSRYEADKARYRELTVKQ